MENPVIVDTTLRDGEQAAGVEFSVKEKVKIACLLESAGVKEIEVGTPVSGVIEQQAIKKIIDKGLNARLIGWNRAVREDIDASLDCGLDSVAVSLPVSDIQIRHKLRKNRDFVAERIKRMIGYAKSRGLYVIAGAEDASRADPVFLAEYADTVKMYGADRLRFCDTVGIMEPFGLRSVLEDILRNVKIAVEIHTHNDFGLAAANALAGVSAGASFVDTTVTGLGERAGNAGMEEVVMALSQIYGIDTGISAARLPGIAAFVSRASGRPIPPGRPIVGGACFLHESGLHQDGIIKNRLTYEPFDPALIGSRSRIVIGKLSGRAAVKHVLCRFGVETDEDTLAEVMGLLKREAVCSKHYIEDRDVHRLYRNVASGRTAVRITGNRRCF